MKKRSLSIVLLGVLLLASCQKEKEKTPLNVLLLCIDDLRPELNCYGQDYIHSPNIDALANKGRAFAHHYVNAPSCGPSRYTLLTGRYGPANNDALFMRSKELTTKPEKYFPSMPEWFRKQGYTTVSVGKVSHHPGGRGGQDWNDEQEIEVPKAWDKHLMPVGEWQHPRGAMHGLANGEIRVKASDMAVYQSVEGDNNIYPDGMIAQEGIKQLKNLSQQDAPFFLAIGLIKPHLPFGAPKAYLDLYQDAQLPPIAHAEKPQGVTTWHGSGEFMRYNRWGQDPRENADFADAVRLHYAACVSYADWHVGQILAELKKSGADKNTIVVLWGDHGWHLGEHAIWGKHSLFEEALHSPLIVYYPGMKKGGEMAEGIVETLDIFPTLCALTHIETPNYAQGTSLYPMLEEPMQEGHPAIAYQTNRKTLRNKDYRYTEHSNGNVELYDHRSPQKETLNIASQNPELVQKLHVLLQHKLNN